MLTGSSEIFLGFFDYELKICQNFAVEFCEYKIPGTLVLSGNSGHWQFQLVCIFLTRFVSGPFFLCLSIISAPWASSRPQGLHSWTYIQQPTLLNDILGPTLMDQHSWTLTMDQHSPNNWYGPPVTDHQLLTSGPHFMDHHSWITIHGSPFTDHYLVLDHHSWTSSHEPLSMDHYSWITIHGPPFMDQQS